MEFNTGVGDTKVLISFSISQPQTYMKTLGTKNHTKTAFLSTQTEDGHHSFVKLAQGVGRSHIKHFSSYDEAITWLLEGKDIYT